MKGNEFDLIILGSGPAGLQAAIHAARAKASVLVMGREYKSSVSRAHVENFCCLGRTDGETLLQEGRIQAEKSGAQFLNEDVIETSQEGERFLIKTESGQELKSRSLILAMGISRNKLGVPGEKELLGQGVSYCVDCDAGFYRGARVAVVGDESAAVSGAMTMLFYADKVHLISQEIQVSAEMAEQIRQSAVIIHENQGVKEILGQNQVDGLMLGDGTQLDVNGVFIELGAKGAIELASTLGVALDAESMKFVETDKKQRTNIPGIFAAGDICGPPWQVAKAVGEGCVAGLEAAAYAKKF
ncbi:MAG: FAD-dependent oxidoreductase [Deltaproteobacteria bacterium]|nr:FAD-dependent oxidoreductase [Deltaproteobacteria bacterium]